MSLSSSVPRERLAILAIEAELCPHVLARILAFLAVRQLVAFSINIERGVRAQIVEIEVDGANGAAMPVLHELRRLPMVRQARAMSLAERRPPAAICAKI